MKQLFATTNDWTLAIARLVLGLVFFMHGAQLALGWFGGHTFVPTVQAFHSMGIPSLLAALAILAQFLGGLGLIVGFLARIAAFGIAVDMLVAMFKVHFAGGFFMNWSGQQKLEGYEYHLLALALCLVIMVKGAGAASADLAFNRSQR
jgi:putative oxidoreductase